MTAKATPIVENADIDRETPQPHIHVEERKLTLHDFLKTTIKVGGSDLHLQAESVPMIRVDGRARFLDCPAVNNETLAEYAKHLLQGDKDRTDTLEHRGACDLSYPMPDGSARFRVNIFHSRQKYAIVMRRIIQKIPMFDELNLPPAVEALADHHRGIVVVSGTTGSGKSTTLAAIIGKINRTRSERILTIEDPIEYQHDNIKSMVAQIEVHASGPRHHPDRRDPRFLLARHRAARRRHRPPGLHDRPRHQRRHDHRAHGLAV